MRKQDEIEFALSTPQLNRASMHQQNELNEIFEQFYGVTPPPKNDREWKSKAQSKIFLNLLKLYFSQENNDKTSKAASHQKLTLEMVMCVGAAFGRKLQWPEEKFTILNEVALEIAPPEIGERLPKGFKSKAAKSLNKKGGIINRKLDSSKGNDQHSYERTIESWINDPIFREIWAYRHKQLQKYTPNKNWEKAFENISE
jgi:hypothetical protein